MRGNRESSRVATFGATPSCLRSRCGRELRASGVCGLSRLCQAATRPNYTRGTCRFSLTALSCSDPGKSGCSRSQRGRSRGDGSLKGLDELASQAQEETQEGGVVLLTQLIGLLLTFIGNDLTLRLVQDVWPEASFEGMSGKEGKA